MGWLFWHEHKQNRMNFKKTCIGSFFRMFTVQKVAVVYIIPEVHLYINVDKLFICLGWLGFEIQW